MDCGHDGWQSGCAQCEAQEREAVEWLGDYPRFPYEIECPTCHAKAGKPCIEWRERGYRVLREAHAARYASRESIAAMRRASST